MNLKEACKYVADHFEYTPDPKGQWRIMQGALMKGDCEDYSLTVLYLFYGSLLKMIWAILKGEARINQVGAAGDTSKKGRHAVGSVGKFYFDNWTLQSYTLDRFKEKTRHEFTGGHNRFFVLWKLAGVYGKVALGLIPVSIVLLVIYLKS